MDYKDLFDSLAECIEEGDSLEEFLKAYKLEWCDHCKGYRKTYIHTDEGDSLQPPIDDVVCAECNRLL